MGKNIIIFIFFSVSLVTVRGFGARDNCEFRRGKTVKDFSIDPKEFPGIKSDKDVSRNQDSVGWCQSFAVADFMCYHMNTRSEKKLKDQCSAADLRLNFGPQDSFINTNEGRSNYSILMNYNGQGVCPENVFPSEYWNNNEILTKDLFEKLESGDKKTRTEAGVALYELCPECMEKTVGDSAKSMLDKLNQGNVSKTDFLKKLNSKMCDGKRVGAGSQFKIDSKFKDLDVALKTQLMKKKPVLITLRSPGEISPYIKADPNTGHDVLVIGMDIRNNGRGAEDCYYVIKNSWGNSCDYIVKNDPQISCDQKTGLLYVASDRLLRKTTDQSGKSKYTFADDPLWLAEE